MELGPIKKAICASPWPLAPLILEHNKAKGLQSLRVLDLVPTIRFQKDFCRCFLLLASLDHSKAEGFQTLKFLDLVPTEGFLLQGLLEYLFQFALHT